MHSCGDHSEPLWPHIVGIMHTTAHLVSRTAQDSSTRRRVGDTVVCLTVKPPHQPMSSALSM
uniref:Uncharacterized protein n=1 Tax=Setaria viridis TaxID=4556 RepID=A0A4U6W9J9_SETVI|nr:hypothetical protein SEVIR_1G056533v2 [Setaria viridis]